MKDEEKHVKEIAEFSMALGMVNEDRMNDLTSLTINNLSTRPNIPEVERVVALYMAFKTYSEDAMRRLGVETLEIEDLQDIMDEQIEQNYMVREV